MDASTRTNRLLPWAVALALGSALFILNIYVPVPRLHINPAESAHRVTTQIAIDEFDDGRIEPEPYNIERAGALAGILLLFVIGPSLWIYGEIRRDPEPQSGEEGQPKEGGAWYLGLALVSFALLMFIPVTIKTGFSFQNRTEQAEQSRTADRIRYNLALLGFEASERYYLPQELGGGSRSFKAIAPAGKGDPRPLTIGDISEVIEDTLNQYMVGTVRDDSTLFIYGISHKRGRDPNFKNANGERGKVQLAVEVLPEGRLIEFDRSADKRN